MKLYSENENYKLYHGNMLDMLEVIEPNSIDSIITDPPYELNFMGKGWDNSGIAFQKETWQKCYEVLKPGGYLLAFGGSRTFHRIACAIEDAGFEIRDTIMWLYGSGFPKSMDISKQIDKRPNGGYSNLIKFGNYIKQARENKKLSKKELGKLLFNFDSNREDVPIQSWEIGKEIPKKEVYDKVKKILELNDDMDFIFEEAERKIIGKGKAGLTKGTIANFAGTTEFDLTAPSTDLAKQWQGWGTALKPSFEPIIVARKPFKGSLVDNVIEYNVGGINIDECRVESNGEKIAVAKDFQDTNYSSQFGNENFRFKQVNTELKEQGRFPANTILTYDDNDFDEVCGGFPYTKSNGGKRNDEKTTSNMNVPFADHKSGEHYVDSGSASRYFYCAKASKKDRDEGLDEFETKSHSEINNRKEGSAGATRQYGGGTNPFLSVSCPRKNTHPTVKPTELMQYLVRLVSPDGATILDPFNGSGSTGKAVMYENREKNKNYKYIGIELTEEYLPIAKARIEYVCNLPIEKDNQMTIFDFIEEE